MDSEKEISFPNDLLEKMTVETTIFTAENPKIGIAILSEREDTNHVVHIYHLVLSTETNKYDFIQELAAFRYKKRHEVEAFLERLPDMSALEMLIMLNPLPPPPSLLN